jgi:hypothetical protein
MPASGKIPQTLPNPSSPVKERATKGMDFAAVEAQTDHRL